MAQSVQQIQATNVAPQIRPLPNRQTKTQPRRVPYAPVSWGRDIKHLIGAIALITIFAIGSVWVTNQTTAYNDESRVKSAQLDKLRNSNTDLKEQISALTTQDRLNEIAQKAGMTLENENIKNVK
ncbi:cell division protein FtsL [Weissella diestrammenae]|uniref:Cell division protein FtsL n=1 Tax=Weissella diestrammenae TaxID=1162633 RepID=A0A7G9T640_9LACO|nr:cell division protein FtsL [Weissella diestrammenae]MCM0582401.1 cell division protein FtsL [Weissella diestrammenae]QNN75565.1 cell division protein FtsL [Weissella diestrammenae]